MREMEKEARMEAELARVMEVKEVELSRVVFRNVLLPWTKWQSVVTCD